MPKLEPRMEQVILVGGPSDGETMLVEPGRERVAVMDPHPAPVSWNPCDPFEPSRASVYWRRALRASGRELVVYVWSKLVMTDAQLLASLISGYRGMPKAMRERGMTTDHQHVLEWLRVASADEWAIVDVGSPSVGALEFLVQRGLAERRVITPGEAAYRALRT